VDGFFHRSFHRVGYLTTFSSSFEIKRKRLFVRSNPPSEPYNDPLQTMIDTVSTIMPTQAKRESILKKITYLRQKEKEAMNEEERSFYKHAMKVEVANLKAVNNEEKEETEATARSEEETTELVDSAKRDDDEDVVMAAPPPTPTMAPAAPINKYSEKRESILNTIVFLRKKENEAMNAEERSFYEHALKCEIDSLTALNKEEKEAAAKKIQKAEEAELPKTPSGEEAVEPIRATVMVAPATPQIAPAKPMNPYSEKREAILKNIVFLRQKENEAMYSEEREFFEHALRMEINSLKALSDEEHQAGKKKEEQEDDASDITPSRKYEYSGEDYQSKRESVIKSIVELRKHENEAMNASQRALVQQQLEYEVKRLISLNAEEKELIQGERIEK
jgi:hypothetical protein